jgi:hypothetical protein
LGDVVSSLPVAKGSRLKLFIQTYSCDIEKQENGF